jgi:DNA invertase Pin-like site-specific DNA recombinase
MTMQEWLALSTTRGAISYARFSHPSQIETDSLRRQAERTRQVVEAFGLELDATVRFADLGISAFKGANRRKGALADIIEAARSGAIPRYTKLIVESVDRISRQDPYAAMGAVRELCDLDVIIVTADMQVYSRDRLARDPGAGFVLQGVLLRAHEEAKTKSERVRAARERNRQALRDGTRVKLPKMLPGWLRNEAGVAVQMPARVETLRMIFDLAADGVGSATIAARLNRDERETFHRGGQGIADRRARAGWNGEAVLGIIRNPAARGFYQPHTRDAETGKRVPAGEPVRCYPIVVPDVQWHAANAHVTRRAKALAPDRVPNRAKIANLLSGVVTCSLCSGRASRYSSDSRRKEDPQGKLICDAAHRSYMREGQRVCRGVGRHPYKPIEDALLADVAPALALRAATGARLAHAGAVGRARQEATEAKDTTERIERRLRRLLDLDVDDPLLVEATAERKAAMARLRAAQEAVERETSGEAAENAMARAMEGLIAGARAGDVDARLRLRDVLREHLRAILYPDRCEIVSGALAAVIDCKTGRRDFRFASRSLRKSER